MEHLTKKLTYNVTVVFKFIGYWELNFLKEIIKSYKGFFINQKLNKVYFLA